MRDDLPVWRSLMFIPVTAEKFVRTGADRGADAIILDLEDAVAPSQKDQARTLIAAAIPQVARNGADVVVRVNRPWRLLVRDLEAAVIMGVHTLMLTKVDSPEHVIACGEIVTELEDERGLAAGGIRFIALVENAAGFFRIEQIARCHPRLVGISLGSEDFAADVGMQSEPEGLFYPKQQTIFAARAAGIMPMGFIGSIADFRDQEAFRAIVRRSRRLGFMCASAVHPLQVAVLNEEFSPDPAEVERARRMIVAYDEAYARGLGAVQFEGAMIDVPVVDRARSVVKRAAALGARVRA
ncbi:HpcH/HpaI aldolase/citrate lyase family protein [Rhodopila sp.]|uniref:HpcH/HpaI aldolase/citrate lyase family protein n=1 Tax=Rhodopila sp. TaxID=2480087 RepID=UPI003D1015E1